MSIWYTNETSPNKRNEIFSILASCSTDQFNLEAPVQGVGYVRKFRECFLIDNSGNFSESVLLTEYVNSFIKEEYDSYEPHTGVYYNLDTLEKALNFTLISEGWLRNEQTYGDSVTLRVRLHSLIVGENAKYFDVDSYVSLETYISSLLINEGKKYQIVNINLSDIDDDFAKVLTKIYSRLIFSFAKGLKNRGSIPFHIILEEAHRYIQEDNDRFLFGYNIFERIAKEGRKYGVILGIITQRPVELSDNVISQCTNFLIFKINHPMDIDYIRKTIPHITDDIIEKQKSLQSGTCLGFGLGFKIPLIVKMEMPDPAPLSGNCDVVKIWNGNGNMIKPGNAAEPNLTMPVFNTNVINEDKPKESSNDIATNLVSNENNNEASNPIILPQNDSQNDNVNNNVFDPPISNDNNSTSTQNNNLPSLINIVDAPEASIPMKADENIIDKPSIIISQQDDSNNNDNNDQNDVDNNKKDNDITSGTESTNPSLNFINSFNNTSDEVPEISNVNIGLNGMVNVPTSVDKPSVDLNLDDNDESDNNNEDFDD